MRCAFKEGTISSLRLSNRPPFGFPLGSRVRSHSVPIETPAAERYSKSGTCPDFE